MLKALRIATEFLDEDAFTVKAQFSPMMKPSQAELDRAASAHKDALEQLVNSFAKGKVEGMFREAPLTGCLSLLECRSEVAGAG